MLRISLSIAAIALAGPALAQATPDAGTPAATPATAAAPAAAASAKPNIVAGAQVVDSTGAPVGTIESVSNGVATLSTGTHKAGIPVASFAQGDGKLLLGLTKAQVDAQGAPIPAGTATASATGATTAAGAATTTTATTPAAGATTTAAATAPASITVGATVKDQTGATVGTVKAVSGDMVTVASATASAQLPKKSFAQSGDSLVIGLTAAQFESAAKAAGGAKKG